MGEGVLVVYQNGAGPSLIVSGLNQRVYPNTHCSGIGESKGLQWVLSDATHVNVYEHKGCRCIHLLYQAWEHYEEFANTSFSVDDGDGFSCRMYRY